jgi:hypothetical protein
MYGGLIWGFSATRYIDSFPKYYIFGNIKPIDHNTHCDHNKHDDHKHDDHKHDEEECNTTYIFPGTTDEPTTTICPTTHNCNCHTSCKPKPSKQDAIFSLINSVNIIILSILTNLIGFGFDEVYVSNIGISYLAFCGFYFFYKHYKQRLSN